MAREEKPDQARSWAIALAACVINTMLSGISRTSGLFYVALIDTYGVTRLQANLPFTVRNIVRNLTGPLVGAIGQKYGARDVTILGGVFASLGIMLCAFVSSITWITILWGGMYGLGVALGNTLFQVVVLQYFIKYRATASGLAISGACVGSFVFPIIIEYTLLHTGLYGTFLITAGLCMQVLPAAIMMKEPPWIRPATKPHTASMSIRPRVNTRPSKQVENNMGMISEEPDIMSWNTKEISMVSVRKISSRTTSAVNDDSVLKNWNLRKGNGFDNPAYIGSNDDLTRKESGNSKLSMEYKTDNHFNDDAPIDDVEDQVIFEEMRSRRLRTISIGEASAVIPYEPPPEQQETSLVKGIQKVIQDPMFHLISFSLGAFAMMFDPAITVIVDYLMDKGMDESLAKYFISLLALGDLFGRLCLGWVTDKNYLSVPSYMMLLLLVQGICFILMPIFYHFDVIMCIMVIYGLASGANLVMFPILVGKYLQSVQSLAIGSINFFSGVLSFAVPPLIGYFRDRVGSYDGMFYITGGMSVVFGFMWLLEPSLMKLKHKLESKASTTPSPS